MCVYVCVCLSVRCCDFPEFFPGNELLFYGRIMIIGAEFDGRFHIGMVVCHGNSGACLCRGKGLGWVLV